MDDDLIFMRAMLRWVRSWLTRTDPDPETDLVARLRYAKMVLDVAEATEVWARAQKGEDKKEIRQLSGEIVLWVSRRLGQISMKL